MSDLKLAIKLSTQGGQLVVKDLQQVDSAADKVSQSLGATGKTGAVAGQGLSKASGGADVLTGSLKSMLAQAAGVIALGVGIDKIATGMYDGIDAFQGYRGQLKTITGDFDSASAELDRLIKISKETPFTLAQSVEGFSKLTHLGLDPSKKSMISYGNTAAAMGKDLMQMIEAVADASVGEFERLKEFGIKASSQGENVRFTFQNVSNTIKKDAQSIQQYLIDLGNNKFGDAMGDQMTRLSAKSSNLQTSIAQLYNEIGNLGASNNIGNSIDGIASLIDEITANLPEILEDITSLLEVMAIVVGSRLLAAYTSLVANGIKSYIASNIAATVSTNAMGQVISKTTVKMNLMAAAGKAAKGSLALLGGPVGVAMLAGYALYELNDAMGETKTGAEQLEEAIGKTTKALENMTRAEQLSTQAAYKKLINEKKAAIEELKALAKEQAEQANNTSGKNSSTAYGVQSWGNSEQAKAAAKELEALKNALSDVEGALFNAGMAGIQWNKVIVDGVEVTKEKAVVTAQTVSKDQEYITALTEQVHMLSATAKQRLLNSNLSQLSAKATLEDIAAVQALTEAQYEQLQVNAQIKQDDDFYQNAIDAVNGYADAWSSAGNVIIDTFGSIGQQMEKMLDNENAYNRAIEINHDKRLIKGADLEKLKKEEAQLTRANAQSEINSYGSMAGAAADMFDEKSKAAKTFHAIEQMMAAASLAMSVEKMIMGTTETGVHVANETTKQGANALTAITSAFAAPFPVNFFAGAAMIGIMASLLGGGFSSSGTAPMSAEMRQETQGTGTILGSDDKSASIANAIERQEELQLDQYAEMQKMNESLNDLNNNITNLVANIVSNFGKFDEASYSGTLGKTEKYTGKATQFNKLITGSDHWAGDPLGDFANKIIGSFNTTKKSLIDSGISIVSQTMSDVIDSGLLQAQAYFDIKTKKKSFWGLSSSTSYNTEYQDVNEQLEYELGLVIANIGTSINTAVDILGINTQKSLDDYIINIGNMSFKDLSGDEIREQLEGVISSESDLMATYLVPSLQEYQQVGEGLYETLIRLAQEQAVFNSVLELTGNAMATVDANTTIAATQAIIEFAGGIENLQDAASTFFSEFLSDDEQFAHLQKNLTAQFDAIGEKLPETAEGFKQLIQGLDPLNEADQKLYAQLLLLSGQSAEYYDALDDQLEKEKELSDARKSFNDDLTAQIANMDLTPLEQSLNSLNNQYVEDLANALELGADISLLEVFYGKQRTKIIEEQLGNAKTTFDTAISGIADGLAKLIDSIANTRTGIAASIRNIKKQMGGFDEVGFINSNINGLYNDVGTGSISEQIDAVESLNDLIMQRYELELEQQTSLQDARSSLYDEQLAQYDSLKSAIKSIGSYSKGLSLSSYSPLSSSQRLSVASRNFSSDLSAAQNFDLTALENLGSSADAYLEEARNMFGSSGQFSAIFNRVQSSLNQIANLDVTAPEQLSVDELYQKEALALQTNTITELQSLGLLLDDLEAQANSQAAAETVVVTEQFNTQVALIEQTNELSKAQLEKQTQQVALAEKSIEIGNAQLAQQTQATNELIETVAKQNEIIAVLQQQLQAIQEGNRNQSETNGNVIATLRQA